MKATEFAECNTVFFVVSAISSGASLSKIWIATDGAYLAIIICLKYENSYTKQFADVRYFNYTLVERRSLAGELSQSCARPAADGWPLMWVSHPLQVSQLGQLSLSSFRGR